MADEHKRVEAQLGITGSGMATDPERIAQLQSERARRERSWREQPKRKFGEVLSEPKPREEAEVEVADEQGETAEEEGAQSAPEAITYGDEPLARHAPDPRMRALHARFEQKSKKRKK